MKKETGKQITKIYNKSISGDLIGDIRRLIETARQKEYNRLATNPKVTIADLKNLEEWRD